MIGSAPMMPAEAFASMLIALILPLIFLRSRSTRERLPSASDRLPPALLLDGDDDGEEVRLGHRHALGQPRDRLGQRHAQRLGLDDLAGIRSCTGSAASLAMILRQSLSGRPALTPRTMTSTAFGEFVEEFLEAALAQEIDEPARQAEERRRRPKRDARAERRRRRARRPATKTTTPQTTLMMKKVRLRPAQAGLLRCGGISGGDFELLGLGLLLLLELLQRSWTDLRRSAASTGAPMRAAVAGACWRLNLARAASRPRFSLWMRPIEQRVGERRRRSAWRAPAIGSRTMRRAIRTSARPSRALPKLVGVGRVERGGEPRLPR